MAPSRTSCGERPRTARPYDPSVLPKSNGRIAFSNYALARWVWLLVGVGTPLRLDGFQFKGTTKPHLFCRLDRVYGPGLRLHLTKTNKINRVSHVGGFEQPSLGAFRPLLPPIRGSRL